MPRNSSEKHKKIFCGNSAEDFFVCVLLVAAAAAVIVFSLDIAFVKCGVKGVEVAGVEIVLCDAERIAVLSDSNKSVISLGKNAYPLPR